MVQIVGISICGICFNSVNSGTLYLSYYSPIFQLAIIFMFVTYVKKILHCPVVAEVSRLFSGKILCAIPDYLSLKLLLEKLRIISLAIIYLKFIINYRILYCFITMTIKTELIVFQE